MRRLIGTLIFTLFVCSQSLCGHGDGSGPTGYIKRGFGEPSLFLLRQQPDLAGLEEALGSGLDAEDEKPHRPRRQRIHQRIIEGLQNHPGGRLKPREFARSINVSIQTLYKYRLHERIDEENKRRDAVDPLKKKIQVLGRRGVPADLPELRLGLTFATPHKALRYFLENPTLYSLGYRMRLLREAGHLVDQNGIPLVSSKWLPFSYAANALTRFYKVSGEPVSLEVLQRSVPPPPEGLTQESVFRTLLNDGRKPPGLSWHDYVPLLAVAYPAYAPVTDTNYIARIASELGSLHRKPGRFYARSGRSYVARFGPQLRKSAESYRASLPAGKIPTQEDLALYFLRQCLEGKLPKKQGGRLRKNLAEPEGSLVLGSFFVYLPAISYELFRPLIKEWRTTAGLEETLPFVSQDPELSGQLHRQYLGGTLSAKDFVGRVLQPFQSPRNPDKELVPTGADYVPGSLFWRDADGPMRGKIREIAVDHVERSTADSAVRSRTLEAVDHLFGHRDGEVVYGRPMEEMTDDELIEMALELIRVATGVADPYAQLKADFNEQALAVLPAAWQIIEQVSDPKERLKRAIGLGILGNAIDFADPDQRKRLSQGFDMEAEIQRVVSLTYRLDAREEFLEVLDRFPQGEILFLVDNAGEIVFDLPLIRIFLEEGHRVTIGGKSLPHANDMTEDDLIALFRRPDVRRFLGEESLFQTEIIATGTAMPGLNLRWATPKLVAAWKRAAVIYAKGQGMVATLRYNRLIRDVFHATLVKSAAYFREAIPVHVGDALFLHTQAATGLEETVAGRWTLPPLLMDLAEFDEEDLAAGLEESRQAGEALQGMP